MNILAFDTADEVLSVALEAENGVWYSEIDAGLRHSELLMECTDSLCKTAGFNPGGLDRVACMKGPGSFTGLRIGFSAAKGLALALGIPLAAVPTLDCLSRHLSAWPGLVLPVMDAKKGCFFAAFYRGKSRVSDYMDAAPEVLAGKIAELRPFPEEPVILTGSGAALLFSRLEQYLSLQYVTVDTEFRKGRAKELLEIARHDIVGEGNNGASGPVYFRKSDAELNLG